ncbi:MAG: PilC/PilY family type IV pilus protein [Pseudomonadota bacterium]
MKTNSFYTTCLASLLYGAALCAPAHASDIETLVGQVQDFAGPNVTLVIDTSGSMASEVFLDSTVAPYDSTVDYTGPFDVHEAFGFPLRLFYTVTPLDSIDFLDASEVDTNQWIETRSFVCQSGQSSLVSAGRYTDRIAQFRLEGEGGTWGLLFPADEDDLDEGGQDDRTECLADYGIHGDGVGDGTFPINLDSLPTDGTTEPFPWSADPNDPQLINWAQTSTRYTFFTPNYLNWIYEREQNSDAVVLTRLEIVQEVATDLVVALSERSLANNDGLRLGLMRFSANGGGGMVLAPTTDIASGNANLINKIQALSASSSTPLAETIYESYLYHAGGTPRFGLSTTPSTSVAEALDGGQYKSPIVAACQRNYMILLTDGLPNGDFEADADIAALTGGCADGSCLDEMTQFMSTADLATGSGFSGTQSVETFIIGFFTDSTLLQNATTAQVDTSDDGIDEPDTPGYFLANNREQLRTAFDDIFGVNGIQGSVATFTAPAVSVNTLNRFTNRDTLYFTLYQPSPSGEPHWDGNLKAYKIGRTTTGGDIQILDADGNPAVDPGTGLFRDAARSIWSNTPDGSEVAEGGVAERLSADRKIYSNLTTNKNLSADDNRISRDNVDAIGALPGMPTGDELLQLIDFTAGLDADGMSRRTLGDPLHSQPLVINFDGGPDDLLLVFGSNDGYLHAIDPTQGAATTNDLEEFAFIPKELLPEQVKLKANLPAYNAVDNKTYGMDGPINFWIENDDGDFVVESGGERLWIYAGMRRGGRSYYAFDMTDRASPSLEFVIDNGRTGYSNLGQTWSSASVGKIKLGNTERDVLIFGGGYDPNQDSSNSADAIGNSVYIADAKTGDLIWSAGGTGTGADLVLSEMTHSIPSDVRIIDTDNDGYVDRLYVGDMAAQVWRFDINPDETTLDAQITGGRLADLGGNGSANERRFFSAPSVSRYVEDGRSFLAIGLGSGYRAHPLETTINDNFYVLRDDNVFSPALGPNGDPEYGDANADLLTTELDLIALTLNGIQDGSTSIDATTGFGRGWFLSLDAGAGEKSLSSAVTAEGRIFFTTYSPQNQALSCDPVAATGLGRFYGIDILSGLPALYDDALASPPIASVELGPTGIPPQPRLVFVEPDCEGCTINPGDPADDGLLVLPTTADIIAQVGTQAFNVGLASKPVRTYWVEF